MARIPSETSDNGIPAAQGSQDTMTAVDDPASKSKEHTEGNGDATSHATSTHDIPSSTDKETRTRKTSRASEPFDQAEREEMEHLLEELRGHLGKAFYNYSKSISDISVTSGISHTILGRRRHRQ